MQNNDLFSNSRIVPAKRSSDVVPYQKNQSGTAMMLAAAHPVTRQRISKEVMSDQCRMLLACNAMENVLLISALESHCNSVAPEGSARYKLIADSYAVAAARSVGRW